MKSKTENPKQMVYIVLAVSYFIDPRVKQEVKTLKKNGYLSYVLSWDREGKYSNLNEEQLFVRSLRLLQARKFSKLLFLISAVLFQIAIVIHGIKLLRKNKSIILHANDFNTMLGVVLLKICFSRKIRVLYDCHELTPAVYEEWYGRLLGKIIGHFEKNSLKFVDEIITVSPPIQNYLQKISKKKVHLLWNYPSKDLFPKMTKKQARTTLGIEQNSFVLMYVGSLRLDIALLELIRSIDFLKKRDKECKITVFIVGDGPLEESLKKEVKEKALEKTIYFTGRVSRTKSLAYLIAADLSYILFTVKGMNTKIGMPWKLYESLVAGTPVLVNANTYSAQFVKNKKAGYIIEDTRKESLAAELVKIIEKKEGHSFKKQQQLIWEKQEENYLKILQKLTN